MTRTLSSSPSLSSSLSSLFRHGQLFLLVGACLGGQASAACNWSILSSLWIVGFGLLACSMWWFARRRILLVTLCSLLIWVVAYGSLQRALHPNFPPDHLRHLTLPREVTIEGWLFREPERFPHRGRLYLETLRVWKDSSVSPATGKILLTVRSLSGSWQYGDVLRVPLKLRTPRNFHTPGSFDYEGYLARHDIYLTAFLWDDHVIERIATTGNPSQHWIERLRRELGTFFNTHLDTQTAAVLRALILGDEGLIDKDLRQAFAQAGVTHVLSISGLHIALVAVTAYGMWWWVLGRSRVLLLTFTMPKLASILAMPPVLFYAALAGGNVATWRSVVMVFAFLLARVFGRHGDLYRSLALAALITSVVWPGAVLDISFQLSFVSVLSIVLGMQHLSGWLGSWTTQPIFQASPGRTRLLRSGVTYGAVSAYALLGTAPLTAFYFNQIALAGLVANVVVVPLLGSAAVILGLLTVAGFFLDSHIAALFLWLTGMTVHTGNMLVQWFAALPYASVQVVTPSELELLIVYTLLLSLLLCSFLQPHVFRVLLSVLLMTVIADVGVWISYRYFSSTLRVSFLDIGQGDAAVIELPDGQVMVVDGGGFAGEDFDSGEAIIAPFLWGRKIGHVDILVMSHPQLDHYGGLLYLADHFSPRELWFNGEQGQGERFTKFMDIVTQKGIQLRTLCHEAPPPHLPQVSLQVLHPPCHNSRLDTNNASLVLRLSYGTTDILFTGDIEKEGETVLLSATTNLPSEILKVPHHGSRTSSSPAFVSATTPELAIASLGVDNRFHFPAGEVVQRYQDQGSRWMSTDQTGAVTVVSDGQEYRFVTTLPTSLRSREGP